MTQAEADYKVHANIMFCLPERHKIIMKEIHLLRILFICQLDSKMTHCICKLWMMMRVREGSRAEKLIAEMELWLDRMGRLAIDRRLINTCKCVDSV